MDRSFKTQENQETQTSKVPERKQQWKFKDSDGQYGSMGYNFGPLQTINKYLDEIIHSINGFQKKYSATWSSNGITVGYWNRYESWFSLALRATNEPVQVVLSEEAGPRVLQIDPTKALKSQETEATLAVGHRLWPKKIKGSLEVKLPTIWTD